MNVFKAGGVAGVLSAAARRIRTPHAQSFAKCRELVRDGSGIEIGGPSSIFAWGGLIPVYPHARRIDNVNFASKTIWEDATKEGDTFHFYSRKAPGQQFIGEGADLGVTGGALVLVVPARDGAFDHRRPLTTMSHLVEDFEANKDEDDLTHLEEVLRLHDLSRDPGVTDAGAFRERAERNAEFRSIHHHVFDTRLAVRVVFHAGFEVVAAEPLEPYHIVVLAGKPLDGIAAKPLDESALREALRESPFQSDHQSS